jgi:hypothetical protein
MFTSADRLHEINAQIAALKEEADRIKSAFKERGAGKYRGREWYVSVFSQVHKSYDMKLVAEYLTPQQMDRVTSINSRLVVAVRKRKDAVPA